MMLTKPPKAGHLKLSWHSCSKGIAERNLCLRSLHSPGNSIWIPYGLGGFHPPVHGFHMDYFLAGSPAIFPVHTHYGFHIECPWNGAFHGLVHGQSIWIPYGFHGISNEFQLQIHVLFHMESMDQSIWNPWNSPYGFHTWNP